MLITDHFVTHVYQMKTKGKKNHCHPYKRNGSLSNIL